MFPDPYGNSTVTVGNRWPTPLPRPPGRTFGQRFPTHTPYFRGFIPGPHRDNVAHIARTIIIYDGVVLPERGRTLRSGGGGFDGGFDGAEILAQDLAGSGLGDLIDELHCPHLLVW